MRSSNGFRLDTALLAEVRFAALGVADLGALLCLWGAAWNSGGFLPADDATLAALSRLGEGWPVSRLRAALASFFRRDGDRLVAVDLEDQLTRRETISGKRRAAGRASGQARATRVEHLSNTCSTPVRSGPEPVKKRVRKPRQEEDLSATNVKSNDGPPPAGAPVCATPPERENLTRYSHTQGGAGGQLDLFGNPIEKERTTPAPRGAGPDDATIKRVLDHFALVSRTPHPPTLIAFRGVRSWMKKGYTEQQLTAAADHFAAHCTALGREGRFIKGPDNFYGVEDGSFTGFLDAVKIPAPSLRPAAPGGDVGGSTRIRRESRNYDHVRIHRIGTPAPAAAAALPAPPGGVPTGGSHRAVAEGADRPPDAG